MAPTICEDDMDSFCYQSSSRMLRHRSVISYVGRQANRENESSNNIDSNRKENRLGEEIVSYPPDRRNIIKRFRREARMSYESEDSSDSISSVTTPMSFHNYAKRQKFDESDDDISTSNDSNENSVSSSTFNSDLKRGNIRVQPLNYLMPLAPFSPVSSTTNAMTLSCRSSTSPRYINPYYRQDLMEIAMKTIMLLRKNRSLHARLNQLKMETKAFVQDVMSNPENAKLRQTTNQSNEKSQEHSTNVLAIKN